MIFLKKKLIIEDKQSIHQDFESYLRLKTIQDENIIYSQIFIILNS